MISKRPLLSRATQTTARNRPTYFRNSGPLIWRQPVLLAIGASVVVWPTLIAYVPLALNAPFIPESGLVGLSIAECSRTLANPAGQRRSRDILACMATGLPSCGLGLTF